MQIRIQQLLEQLQSIDIPYDRLPLLDEVSFHYRLSAPQHGVGMAEEQLRLSRELKDKHWTMRALVRLSDCYYFLSQYSKTIRYAMRALRLLDDLPDDPAEKAYVYRLMSSTYQAWGDMAKALQAGETSLEFARQSEDEREIVASLGNIGRIYKYMGAYQQSIALFTESMKIYEKRGFSNGIAVTLGNIADIHHLLEDYDTALTGYSRALEIFRTTGNRISEAESLAMIGNIHVHHDEYSLALHCQQEALAIIREVGQREIEAITLGLMAQTYIEQGELACALEHARMALQIHEDIGSKGRESITLAIIGYVHLHMGEHDLAIATLARALEMMDITTHISAKCNAHKLIAQAHESRGEITESLRHYKAFLQLQSDIMGQETRRIVAEFHLRAEIERKDRERIDYQNKLIHMEQEVERRSKDLTLLSLQIAQNNEFIAQLKQQVLLIASSDTHIPLATSLIKDIDANRHQLDAWQTFEQQFQQLDQNFIHNLAEQHPELTPTELKVCSMLRISLSNKEIASIMNISVRTVDTHRTHIRKKLGLASGENLTTVLATI